MVRAVALVLAMLAGAANAAVELMADGNVGTFRLFLVVNGKMGLATPDGLSLYSFAKDPIEKATCTGACAEQWPPLLAGTGDRGFESFSIFTREDGQLQWAFEGKPLYRSIKDTAPGEANGHGVDDAWFVVEVPGHEM
jgi:predicted lipoprotein with Yx(FWY)xxD motif